MTKIKDTDYLTISTRIRAMENKLLTRERMERMLEAHTDDEAVKVLSECGYGELTELTHTALDALLAQARAAGAAPLSARWMPPFAPREDSAPSAFSSSVRAVRRGRR